MNPKQLHCFITAAQEGSFSKAAKKLYLSQQALSKTIDKLRKNWTCRCLSAAWPGCS